MIFRAIVDKKIVDKKIYICFHSIMGIHWKVALTRLFWIWILATILLGLIFYFFMGRIIGSPISDQQLSILQTISRAEKSNIIAYFQSFGNAVAVLAQQRSIVLQNANAPIDMETFIDQRREDGFIGGVALTDKEGRVQLNANILRTKDTGVSLADRDYFLWAKEEGEKGKYYIGKPVIGRGQSTKGQYIIPVAAPVYLDQEFAGIVVSSVKLQSIMERTFGLMKISNDKNVYISDEDGGLIYSSSEPNKVGSNVSELFSDKALREGIVNALKAAEGGRFKTDNYLVAYSPIKLGAQNWLLIVTSPSQEITNITVPIYLRLTALIILISISIFLFGIVSVRIARD